MPRVAIVTDSASDLPPAAAAAAGITVVPLVVNFGSQAFRADVDISTDEFWTRMLAPDAPFPTTAAAAPGEFKAIYERCFEQGADAVVSVNVAGTLSGTIKSAQIARDLLSDREIHIVDSGTVSMGIGMLAQMGAEMAAQDATAEEIVERLEARKSDLDLYVALDTLEYLKRGGRISGARAAIGTMLSIKPIITVIDGHVDTADRIRTRQKARARALELATQKPVERAAILHTTNAEVEEFAAQFMERSGLGQDKVQVMTVGASVGPHLGPGSVGAVVMYRA
jgi:DegV family protein with EDD domain